MESHCRSDHLRRNHVRTKGCHASQQIHKSCPRQPRIRPLQSSQNHPVSIPRFPLARYEQHRTKIHCRIQSQPPTECAAAGPLQHKQDASTTVTTLGRTDNDLHLGPPWVNRLRVYRNLGTHWSIDENDNLPPLLVRFQLTSAARNDSRTPDLQMRHRRQYRYRSRAGIYQRFRNRVWSHLGINHSLSTAFHSHTDGQMPQPNRTMELYLWAFSNYEQVNWVELLPLADVGNNTSVHHWTWMMPFQTNYHYHPPMQFKPPKGPEIWGQKY